MKFLATLLLPLRWCSIKQIKPSLKGFGFILNLVFPQFITLTRTTLKALLEILLPGSHSYHQQAQQQILPQTVAQIYHCREICSSEPYPCYFLGKASSLLLLQVS